MMVNQKSSVTQRFYALNDITFTIPKGEVVGILGTNGSGKSTLSLILAGISQIDEGTMDINGEQALIASQYRIGYATYRAWKY